MLSLAQNSSGMEHDVQTVIAPVGLGGKNAPHIADPAPTLLVEMASVETDRETARIAALLADARRSAVVLVQEATEQASAVLAEASAAAADTLRAAEQEAESARSEAEGRQVELDHLETTLHARVAAEAAEIESVHRIEAQVLREREAELLARIGYLESQLQGAKHAEEDAEPAPDAPATRTVSVDLDSLTPPAEESRTNGRHDGDARVVKYSASGPLTTHAPLTEQLTTSAFRASPGPDRRGRRRR
ncbi:MAG: hypothetical protein WEA76_01580 [Acidimicrobiia bacterium]